MNSIIYGLAPNAATNETFELKIFNNCHIDIFFLDESFRVSLFMVLLQVCLQMILLCERLATFVTFKSPSLMKTFFVSGKSKSVAKCFFTQVTLKFPDSIMDSCNVLLEVMG